jgi:predicted regulator of Ras-like GTPase activity (Roadblock/LC7/MglB family)
MKQVQEIIQQLGQQSGFAAAVLTDASGFALAASAGGGTADAPAAIAALIQRVAEQARNHVGLGAMDEVSMNDEAGQRLVCRWFTAGDHNLVLAVKVLPNVAYRRATTQAIRQIKQVWSFGQKSQ